MKIHFVQLIRIDEQGVMRCPNDKAFHFYRKNVGEINTDVRKNCMNAKTVVDVHMQRNVRRQIRIEPFGSIELTSMHRGSNRNLESIHGACYE